MNRVFARTLDELLEEPVTPHCPTLCCFRELCPTHVQQGVNRLFVEGKHVRREDCFWFPKLARLHHTHTGHEPPATAAELLAQLAEINPKYRELLDPEARAEREAIMHEHHGQMEVFHARGS